MRYVVHYVFIGIILTNSAFSSPDSSSTVLPSVGAQALEFKLSGLFTVGPHLGNGITLKTFTGANRAVRIGIYDDVTLDEETGKNIREYYYPNQDTLKVYENNEKILNNLTTVQIHLQFIRYRAPYHRLSLSYGAGPILGFSDNQTKSNLVDIYRNISDKNYARTSIVYTGLSAMIGVEWFYHKNISFHSEYHTSFKIGKSYYKNSDFQLDSAGNWSQRTETRDGPYYRVTGKVWFGASFYFK